jgi:hypothetical protein
VPVITYRSVDQNKNAVKYVREHAYVTGPYLAEWGPADVDAETDLCLNCINRLNASSAHFLKLQC